MKAHVPHSYFSVGCSTYTSFKKTHAELAAWADLEVNALSVSPKASVREVFSVRERRKLLTGGSWGTVDQEHTVFRRSR